MAAYHKSIISNIDSSLNFTISERKIEGEDDDNDNDAATHMTTGSGRLAAKKLTKKITKTTKLPKSLQENPTKSNKRKPQSIEKVHDMDSDNGIEACELLFFFTYSYLLMLNLIQSRHD
jgi:hypothetical protein